jgi:hypothetical protein
MQRPEAGGIDRANRGSGCRGTGWRARIKGGGCGLFRIDELDASAKVTLLICVILEVDLVLFYCGL